MKGDFTRSTYLPARHYERVRLQQGRAVLDADWNEQVDITQGRIETEALDVIGHCGAPLHDAGLHIVRNTGDLTVEEKALPGNNVPPPAGAPLLVSAGRYYVDGILVANDAICDYRAQPDWNPAAPAPGTWLAYLDVWRRYLNALDDPRIREVALNGPDTSGRVKTVWQVKLLPVPAGTTCGAEPNAWKQLIAPSSGTLEARTVPATPATDPCTLSPGAGYTRLENQLYRIEIHKGGNTGVATFKWSRDNGSVVAAFDLVPGANDKIKVRPAARDKESRFAIGQWVELTDDEHDLAGQPGVLAQVIDIKDDVLQLLRPAPLVDATAFTTNRRVRRWDSGNEILVNVPVANGGHLKIEDGVEIRFGAGTYAPGDYWLIPARTSTGDIDWPFPSPQPPQGIRHHRCKLAIVEVNAAGAVTKVTDCRTVFTPLTEIDPSDECCKVHNKYLHGWGVVCGLQVHCAGATEVRVEPGYALECDGSDLFLRELRKVPVVQLGAALLNNGDGKLCLTIHKAADGTPSFNVIAEPQRPKNAIEAILQGTLLKDIQEDCLAPVLAEIDKALDADNRPGDTRVVNEGRRNRIALKNLAIQLVNQTAGKHVFLSKDEHERLKVLYQRLAKLLQSAASCTLGSGLPPFPGYGMADPLPVTGYGRAEYTGVRYDHSGKRAFAYGAARDAAIDVFDVAKAELAVQWALPDKGVTVQDVLAFERLIVIAATDPTGSFLYVLDPAGKPIDSLKVPGVDIRRLGHARNDGRHPVVAIARGQGAFLFSAEDLGRADFSKPLVAFNATGHLSTSYLGGSGTLLAGEAAAGTHPETYSTARIIRGNASQPFALVGSDGQPAAGDDAVELLESNSLDHIALHAIVAGKAGKRLLVLDSGGKTQFDIPLGDTGDVRLCAHEDGGAEALAFGGMFRGAFIEPRSNAIKAEDVLPMQIAPGGMHSANRARALAVANSVSETITFIPLDLVLGRPRFDMDRFVAYRAAVFNAFRVLFLSLAQRVKDCACDKLQVDCPACSPADRIILACMEIENGQIRHICASHRREVLTFPKLLYWLSAIPAVPALAEVLQRVCCSYLVPKPQPLPLPPWVIKDWIPPKAIPATFGAYKAAASVPLAGRIDEILSAGGKKLVSGVLDGKLASRLQDLLEDRPARADAPNVEKLRHELERTHALYVRETTDLRNELAELRAQMERMIRRQRDS